MLRLPGQDDVLPPLLTPPPDDAEDRIDEIEADEEDELPRGGGGRDLTFILGLVVPALALLGVFAWWIAPGPARPANPATANPLPGAAMPAAAKVEVAPAAGSVIPDVESVVKAFLEAATPEEALRHVRDPAQTAPKLEAWLAGKPYTAPGFREIISDSVTGGGEAGKLLTGQVRTGDFELREIVLFSQDGGFKVDWDSWVGWSEIPWEEFQSKRPVEPKWFRVELSRVDYYNFAFKDESEWVSYRLDSPDGSDSIYGYVRRTSSIDEKIRPIDSGGKVKLLLKLKFPADAPSGNQVLIDDVAGQGWVELPGPPAP